MYTLPGYVRTEIRAAARTIAVRVKIGSTYYGQENIEKFSYEHTSNPDETFVLGSTVSAKINLTLIDINPAFVLETPTYEVEVGILAGGTYHIVPLGKFYADEVKRHKRTANITLYDGMFKLEGGYFSELNYPANIQDVMEELSTNAGVGYIHTVTSDYQIPTKPEGYTYREVAGMIAQLIGGFATFDRAGNLILKNYDLDISHNINSNHYLEYKKKGDRLFQIQQVIGRIPRTSEDDSEVVYTKGELGLGVTLEFENPWVTQEIVDDIYDRYLGFNYIPTWFNFIGDPTVDCGDLIALTTVDNELISVPVMSYKLNYQGGLISEVESVGESQSRNRFDSVGSTNKRIERIISEQASFYQLLANTASIGDLQAITIRVGQLEGATAVIGDLTVTTAKIADLAVTNGKITNLSVDTAKIADLAVDTAKIKDAAITNAKIDRASVDKLVVSTADIEDAAISRAKIKDAAISTAKIDLGAITSVLIAEAAIGTVHIADGSITSAKIVELTADLITAGTLSVDRLLITGPDSIIYEINATSGGLTQTELSEEQYQDYLNGSVIVAESITARELAADSVTAQKILAGAVTAEKINVVTLSSMTADLGTVNAGRIDISGGLKITNDEVDVLTVSGGNVVMNVNSLEINTVPVATMSDVETKVSSDDYSNDQENIGNELENLSSTLGTKASANDLQNLRDTTNNQMSEIRSEYQAALAVERSAVTIKFQEVTNVVDEQGKTVDKVNNFFNFTETGLRIGKTDSQMSTFIDHTKMAFLDGSTEVASISGQRMYIENAEVKREMVIGNHKFERSGNSTVVRWAGE